MNRSRLLAPLLLLGAGSGPFTQDATGRCVRLPECKPAGADHAYALGIIGFRL